MSELTADRALALVAYVVMRHGDAYVPLLERLEAEVAAECAAAAPRERAQRILAGQLRGVKDAAVA